ncbi:MAG TPA: hypothetical protein VEL76_26630 [Gemmataceae bacterium]|nr:hypothetical protein [Gemmataceae bacterium]
MAWPEATDYNEAIQNPTVCFHDPDLKQGQPEVNALGWPLPYTGNFAAVYKVFGPDGIPWAVKCFTREVAGLRERYHAISAHLRQAKLPFMVDFEYLEEGIRIRGDWYAVVKMRWVEGLTLNDFLKGHVDKPQLLEKLSQMWVKLTRELRRAGIAHADLQHGNVLLVPGGKSGVLSVRLIDYDGMHVPALANSQSGEVGHANFQHPDRARQHVYDAEVDRFPHLVIYTALRALLAGGRALWEKHDNGDNLLFREQDFTDPAKSPLFHELWQLPDAAVRGLTTHLARACQGPIADAPLLTDLTDADNSSKGAEKPRTGIRAAKKTASADEPTTVAPGGRRKLAATVAGRFDTRKLLLLGGGAAALLLAVIVGAILLSSGSDAGDVQPQARGPIVPPQPAPIVPVDPGLPGRGPEGNEPAQPRAIRVPDVTLHPGETTTVEVSVDRGEFKGRIELLVAEIGGGKEAPGSGAVPMPVNPETRTLQVDKSIILAPGQMKGELRVTAGANMQAEVREFRVEIHCEGEAFAPKGGGPPGPIGAELPEGQAPLPGGMPAAERVRTTFRVAVTKPPRSNPSVLPVGNVVRGATRDMQLDVLRAAVLALDYNSQAQSVMMRFQPGAKVDVNNGIPAEVIRPHRLVVVTATFPYRQQLDAFRKALGVATVGELFDRPDTTPRFVGLNVWRREVQPDGSRKPPESLYRVEPETDRVTVHPAIEKLLRESAYDDEQAEGIAGLTFPGLATPLPALISGTYPPLDLTGLDSQAGAPGVKGTGAASPPKLRPGSPGMGANARLMLVPLKQFPQEFQDRLEGKSRVFDLHGLPQEGLRGERPPPIEVGPGGIVPGGKLPSDPRATGREGVPAKCLVRFFDADAQPGRVYEYSIQVCLANPNHGKRDEVRTEEEARPRHLLSPAVLTPPVAIGSDYLCYAFDQHALASKSKNLYSPNNRGVDTSPVTADLAPVQIHRWAGTFRATGHHGNHILGDWIIAERLLVPRGELLTRSSFQTQVPEWSQARGRFEFASTVPGQPRLPTKALPNPNILLDLNSERAAPVLVDFRGGKREEYRTPLGPLRDEGALELLVLSPDGKLDVRSNRADSAEARAEAGERQERYEAWRSRLQAIRDTQENAGTDFVPVNPITLPRPSTTYRWWYQRNPPMIIPRR